jgi:hypothetical protein
VGVAICFSEFLNQSVTKLDTLSGEKTFSHTLYSKRVLTCGIHVSFIGNIGSLRRLTNRDSRKALRYRQIGAEASTSTSNQLLEE